MASNTTNGVKGGGGVKLKQEENTTATTATTATTNATYNNNNNNNNKASAPPKDKASTVTPASNGNGNNGVPFKSAEDCLLEIVRRCALHDTSGYFSDPVTEDVAPNYFHIIKSPMDFFTLRKKIKERAYRTWREFVSDLELICSNAMTYNQKRSRVHKAAGHLQRCLRKVLRENELEGRRSILLRHPSSKDVNQNVLTDPDVTPNVSAEAWKDEQEGARTVAERNNLAIKEAEAKCISAYVRSACAAHMLKTPLTKELIKEAFVLDSNKRERVGNSGTDPSTSGRCEGHEGYDLMHEWSSYSETDDEKCEERSGQAAPIVQVEYFKERQQKKEKGEGLEGGEMETSTSHPPQASEKASASLLKRWREDSTRNEIGWRCRWLERRIRHLQAEEQRYEKMLKNSHSAGQQGEAASPSKSVKRRRISSNGKELKMEEAFVGWLNVFSHLSAAPEHMKLENDLEEDDGEMDSDQSENMLVDVMEQALLMHKQVHSLHAQISYVRQNINRQGKIVNKSAMPPTVDTQILKTRIGTQLLALEHEHSLNQNPLSPNGHLVHGSSFDMDNVVSPMGASKIPPPLKVEFISTPRVRDISSAGTEAEEHAEDGGSSEDTSDEAYERLHKPMEIAERSKLIVNTTTTNNNKTTNK